MLASRNHRLARLPAALLLLGLCACGSGKLKGTPDNEPTLKALASRQVSVQADAGVKASEEQAIAAYKKFLDAAPRAPQRAQAMRRLGDLEMEVAESRFTDTPGATPMAAADYRAAIARYRDFLKAYPADANNDRVLYQLARAHEQGGALELALATLDQLVREYPATVYRDEANFRRGELLFTTREYAKAEQAFATVLKSERRNTYEERSLYMQGWSQFKQGRLEDALTPFFGVLDRKLAGQTGSGELDTLTGRQGFTRADRELVEDTFRVASICLQNLQGADSIPQFITSEVRRGYEFRVYQQLGELYVKQDRSKDAADTFGAFARAHPLHEQAPQLQARVVEIYQSAGLTTLALAAKKDHVSRYGIDSEFRRANPAGWALAQPLVKTHLAELARHHHAAAQKSRASADYQEAVRWYRAYLTSFPSDPAAAQNNFLLAELLFEDQLFKEAAVEYEKTAYGYPVHAKSADAGYAALLSYARLTKDAVAADAPVLQRSSVDSALRFAAAFKADTRTGTVLTNASEQLFALKDPAQAAKIAQQVLALDPPAAAAQRRTAWTVLAHTAFERNAFADAERAYAEVLALVPDKDPARTEFKERLAASVYKQGEEARTKGNARDAVGHFARVAAVAPQSSVRATAQYDAAAALIGLKDWDNAARTLEDFRARFANHPLQDDVAAKLALAYTERGQWSQAAGEFERVAAAAKDPQVARAALWQAAELHEKASEKASDKPNEKGGNAATSRMAATKAYERFLKLYPEPLEPAVETRHRLARLARADGNAVRAFVLAKDIFFADQAGGAARTDRTRYLGASAALTLAEPVLASYKQVPLIEPLAKQLKLKKAKLEDVLKAYAVAADYGVADVTTAATFHIAALYQDFGQAMLGSQRPKKLSKAELEQYNVMLEEQADPFAQKATELHEVNARRAATGLYDEWVQKSFKALAALRPLRYGKVERIDLASAPAALAAPADASVATLEAALAANPKQPQLANQLGIALRKAGQFTKARAAYERAIELDANPANATLNLAILHDIYLADSARALALYDRYLALTTGGDAMVAKWVADLKNRKPPATLLSKKDSS